MSNHRILAAVIAAPACLMLAGTAISQTELPGETNRVVTQKSDQSPADAATAQPEPANADLQVAATAPPEPSVDAREAECIAKVVVHEAGNQPYKGMVAVAQVITNRMKHPHFPKTACAVVNQPRQFFKVDAYNPSRKTKVWTTAMQIAHDALLGRAESVVPDALFFNSVGGGMPGRVATARIADHVFYR